VLDENCLPSNIRVSFLDRIFKNSFKTWNSKKYFELLAKFNVDSSKRVKELSKGMKAKLNIAIALTRDVKVLILDEPVNGLDPLSRDELNDILLNFVKDKEHSVLISSHILSDIEIISDKIIFIDKGSIVKIGLITDFKDKYDVVTLSKEQYDNLNKENVFSHKINGDIYTCLVRKGTINEYIKYRTASLEDIMVFYLKGIKDEGTFN
ncbi:MAG: ATP-binding cassette domain-containing protein, partial [Candidatus Onthovivens sp.]|nr:ATP-binding cassette domain-containing protein [Candidatus Onthovivens sp.]